MGKGQQVICGLGLFHGTEIDHPFSRPAAGDVGAVVDGTHHVTVRTVMGMSRLLQPRQGNSRVHLEGRGLGQVQPHPLPATGQISMDLPHGLTVQPAPRVLAEAGSACPFNRSLIDPIPVRPGVEYSGTCKDEPQNHPATFLTD